MPITEIRPVKSHALRVWHTHLAYFTRSHANASGEKYEITPKNEHATPILVEVQDANTASTVITIASEVCNNDDCDVC